MTARKNTATYYDTDLAFVHDQGYGQFAQKAAQTISELIRNKLRSSLIVDLGCGTGILERELAKEKVNIIGIDQSPAMIALAKQNAPGATFLTASIYDFEIPMCDLVCSIGECFNYLFVNNGDLRELKKLFNHVHNSLKPKGYFVFDILTPQLLATSFVHARILERDRWTIFLDIEVDQSEMILTRKITLFLKRENSYQKSKEVHRQRLYHKNDIETILRDIGFNFTIITDYHGLTFKPGHIGFVCTKD